MSTLMPLLDVKKELENKGYSVKLVLGTREIKRLEDFMPFTIEGYLNSESVAVQINEDNKTIYYLYDYYYAAYYFCISDTYKQFPDYSEDKGYEYYWKELNRKGDSINHLNVVRNIQEIFKQLVSKG